MTEVLLYNVRDGFDDPAKTDQLFGLIEQAGPDVAVFPEAYAEAQEGGLADSDTGFDDLLGRFDEAGYHVKHTLYKDGDDREDRHGLLVAARKEVIEPAKMQVVRLAGDLAGRDAILLEAVHDEETDQTFSMGTGHLDDREEPSRSVQADSLIELDADTYAVQTNSMHAGTPLARALRMTRPAARHLPQRDPSPGLTPNMMEDEAALEYLRRKLERIGSLTTRLADMADGRTIGRFEDAGYEDADPRRKGTMMLGKIPVAQLDHILIKKGEIVATQHQRHPAYPFSNHRAVSATLIPVQ